MGQDDQAEFHSLPAIKSGLRAAARAAEFGFNLNNLNQQRIMTCAAATFPGVTAFDCRVFALADYRRAWRGVVVGLGAVTAAGVMAVAVTMIAAWIIGVCFAAHPNLKARTPFALETAALAKPHGGLAGAANLSGLAGIFSDAADAPDSAFGAEQISTAALTAAPISSPQLPLKRPSERANDVPLPQPRPLDGPRMQAQHDIFVPRTERGLPQVADATSPSAAPASFNLFEKRLISQPPRNNSIALPDPDSRTALYDIEAHTVYLPNGERLEAHSGLGPRLDDPRSVNQKDRGPTPPNVYDLVLREEPFHGVRAIRLNPVDDDKMFGRDGILAHTYMLGPTGQSFGCVSFKNYPEFLKAFLKGEIDRLVVVPHLEARTSDERGRRGDADRYAFNNR
jgi:hypothetical protein